MKNKKHLFLILPVLLVFPLISGCFSPIQITPSNEYTLASPNNLKPVKETCHCILTVARPIALAPFNTEKMIYQKDFSMGQFNYNQWKVPIPDMIHNLMDESFNAWGYFKAVNRNLIASQSDYTLQTEVIYFGQDLSQNQNRFRIKLRVSLIENKTNRLLKQKTFLTEDPIDQIAVLSMVKAADQSMESILKQISQFVVKTISTHSSLTSGAADWVRRN